MWVETFESAEAAYSHESLGVILLDSAIYTVPEYARMNLIDRFMQIMLQALSLDKTGLHTRLRLNEKFSKLYGALTIYAQDLDLSKDLTSPRRLPIQFLGNVTPHLCLDTCPYKH